MSQRNVAVNYLKTDGVAWEAKALTSGTAYYSDAIPTNLSTGYASLLIDLTDGSDDIDIGIEVSVDGKNWYVPRDASGTSLGVLIPAGVVLYATTPDWWIVFSPPLARYIRFKFDPDADSIVTARIIQQEA